MTPRRTPSSVLTGTLDTDDGVSLTYYECGDGRPLVLLHGYNAPAIPIWVDTGIAERLAGHGHRVIMPVALGGRVDYEHTDLDGHAGEHFGALAKLAAASV